MHAANNSSSAMLTNRNGKDELVTRPSGKCLFIFLCPVKHKKMFARQPDARLYLPPVVSTREETEMWRASSRTGTAWQLGQ